MPLLRAAVDMSLLVYLICLFVFPSSFGLMTPWFVLSPARLALVIALIPAVLDAGRRRRSERVTPWWPIVLCWLLFLGAATVSAMLNRTDGGLARLASLIAEGAGTFWLVWWVGRRRPEFVHGSLVAITCAVALVTLTMSALGLRYDLIFNGLAGENTRFGIVRQQASFDSPLFLAMWMVAASALAVGLALARTGSARWLGLAAWTASVGVIVTTVSRFAVTAVPLVAAVILVATGRIRLGALALMVGVAVGFIVFFGSVGTVNWDSASPLEVTSAPVGQSSSAPVSTPVAAPIPGSDADNIRGSNEARVEALQVTTEAVQERPLFGWGLLSAKDVAKAKLGHLNYVDNGYLVILIECGLLGLASFLALVTMIGLDVVRHIGRRPRPLPFSQFVSFASLLTFSLVAAFWATSQGYAAFWTIAALAVATAAGKVTDSPHTESFPTSGPIPHSVENSSGAVSTAAS